MCLTQLEFILISCECMWMQRRFRTEHVGFPITWSAAQWYIILGMSRHWQRKLNIHCRWLGRWSVSCSVLLTMYCTVPNTCPGRGWYKMANAGWTTTSSHLVQGPPQHMLTCSGHFLCLYQFISWTLERTESRAGKHMHAYHVMLLTHLQIFYPTFDNYSQRAACVMSEVPTFAQSPRHLVQDLEGGFSPALKWLAHHKDWICLKITLKIEKLVYPPGN